MDIKYPIKNHRCCTFLICTNCAIKFINCPQCFKPIPLSFVIKYWRMRKKHLNLYNSKINIFCPFYDCNETKILIIYTFINILLSIPDFIIYGYGIIMDNNFNGGYCGFFTSPFVSIIYAYIQLILGIIQLIAAPINGSIILTYILLDFLSFCIRYTKRQFGTNVIHPISNV